MSARTSAGVFVAAAGPTATAGFGAFGAAGAYGRFSYATSDDAIAAGIGRLVDLVSRGS